MDKNMDTLFMITGDQACSQTGALGAIAPSVDPIAPSGTSLCILCTRTSLLLLPCLVDFSLHR